MSGALSGWVQALLWAITAAAVVSAGVALAALVAFRRATGSSGGIDELQSWVDADDAYSGTVGGFYLVAIALFVLLIVWTNRCHRTVERLRPGPRRWTAGWAIGAWFIPLANAVLPKLVIDETERIAKAPRVDHTVVPTWRSESTDALGWAWWVLFVAGLFILGVSGSIASDYRTATDTQIESQYVVAATGLLVVAIAAPFGALFVRRYSRRLTATAMVEG